MKILITGASGLIGTALQDYFPADYQVLPLFRNHKKAGQPYWSIDDREVDLAGFEPDVVIHLAGENIAGGRWTKARKDRILNSRKLGTRLLVNHLVKMENKPHTLISGSAIGYYGLRDDQPLDEDSGPGNAFVTEVCLPWEAATKPAEEAGIRVVNIRTGIVLSRKGGALTKMLPPFKFGLGGKIGSGKQYMSWVSINDMVRMIDFLIQHSDIHGPVNMTAPNPVTNAAFTKALGKALHRPTPFPMPSVVAKLLFGEMAEELLLGGARVMPKKLKDAGYTFEHQHLRDALHAVL